MSHFVLIKFVTFFPQKSNQKTRAILAAKKNSLIELDSDNWPVCRSDSAGRLSRTVRLSIALNACPDDQSDGLRARTPDSYRDWHTPNSEIYSFAWQLAKVCYYPLLAWKEKTINLGVPVWKTGKVDSSQGVQAYLDTLILRQGSVKVFRLASPDQLKK